MCDSQRSGRPATPQSVDFRLHIENYPFAYLSDIDEQDMDAFKHLKAPSHRWTLWGRE